MSAHPVDALAASIYDRLIELDITHDLDNEQIWQAAHVAAQTIEATGIRIPRQEHVGFVHENGLLAEAVDPKAKAEWRPVWADLP